MSVRVYRSTDASAPVLTGQVGTLVALLDACLVSGYGSQTAAGWTKPFSTTNKAAFQQNATGANNAAAPMLLYVDDTGPGAGGAREARVCGFETMSAITPTGTGQFPTSSQSAIGVGTLVVRKSTTADATARAWTLIANGQTIYLFTETGDFPGPNLGAFAFIFGDLQPYKATDLYAVGIIGRNVENSSSVFNDPFHMMGGGNTNWGLSARYFGHFLARSWSGVGGSVQCGKTFDFAKVACAPQMGWSSDVQTVIGTSVTLTSGRNGSNTGAQFPAPNPADGSLWMSPIYVFHNFAMRGYWPGLWALLHDKPMAHNDVITVASGNLSGKTLLCQQFAASINSASDVGQVMVETSDTWP